MRSWIRRKIANVVTRDVAPIVSEAVRNEVATFLSSAGERAESSGGVASVTRTCDRLALFPIGHFYSPYVAFDQIDADEARIWPATPPCEFAGIDLGSQHQVALVESFAEYRSDVPFGLIPGSPTRYGYDNEQFGAADALVLYSMLRHAKPARIVEIGAGFSTGVMLDTFDLVGDRPHLTSIDPYPDRLLDLMRPGDGEFVSILRARVQDLPLDIFAGLTRGDILFIDSSHVAKPGSDVAHLFFEVIPRLAPGVLIHIHDVLYPFEYPRYWLEQGRAWNEAYLVRALLIGSTLVNVVLYVSHILACYPGLLQSALPDVGSHDGGSLWLKVANR